jgi:hypothetical protein
VNEQRIMYWEWEPATTGGRRPVIVNGDGSERYPVSYYRVGRHNMCGKRYDFWWKVPGDPRVWHGWHTGDMNTVVHCAPTKRTEL